MTKHDEIRSECWSRTPHYRPGARLTAEQLNAAQADSVRRDRLVNVAMHGVGVAYGFQVRTTGDGKLPVEGGCIHISCGLAFDRHGRVLFWSGGTIGIDDIVGPAPRRAGTYTLAVHYAEATDRLRGFDPCREGTDWVERCVAFTLTRDCRRHDACGPKVGAGDCMTRREWICSRNGFEPGDVPMDAALEFACAAYPPLAASDCGRVSYDPESGIALSCVEICDLDRDKEDCDPRFGFCPCGEVDNCRPRPVAYRSRLLYELIDDDDVPSTKVRGYSWQDWELHEWRDQVPFSAFARRARACREPTADPRDGFSLMFTRPVQRRTLHPMSLIMNIFILETRANYWEPWRIPTRIRHLDEHGQVLPDGSAQDCVWGAMICPERDWIAYEIDDPKSTILECANRGQLARVEITLRCQLARDCCGLMLDARPPDIDANDPCRNRAGQARPGDDLLFVFRVGRDPRPDDHGRDARGEQASPTTPDEVPPPNVPWAGDGTAP